MPRSPLVLVALLLAAASCGTVATPDDAPPARRPNVLLVVADDQSVFDLPIYEPSSPLHAPHLARLAAEGTTIDAAYHMGSWSGAVCTPSRHMIMSGRTLWHLPSRGIGGEGPNALCPPDLAEQTLPAVFARAGYETMRTCKRGNSYEGANEQFQVRHDATKRGAAPEDGSAWHGERVLEYLDDRAARDADAPFFVYLGFSHPHDPRPASDALLARYGASNDGPLDPPTDATPALPVNHLTAHPFPDGHPELRDEVAVDGMGRRRDPATVRNEFGRQLACSDAIDVELGRVLAHLEASGELEHTIVVYTADHGIAIGRHGLAGKQNLYEHSWRVPLVVRGPGVAAGARARGNVYLLDLLATLCDLTGVEAPETSEGTSFRDVLAGRADVVRDVLYGAYCGGTKPGMRSVRRGDWKLIEYEVLDGTVRETQLFDLSANPYELLDEHHDATAVANTSNVPAPHQRDLADDPDHAAIRAELEALLRAEMQRLDDPYAFTPAR